MALCPPTRGPLPFDARGAVQGVIADEARMDGTCRSAAKPRKVAPLGPKVAPPRPKVAPSGPKVTPPVPINGVQRISDPSCNPRR